MKKLLNAPRWASALLLTGLATGLLTSCVDDEPVFDRVVSPVLVVVPNQSIAADAPVVVTARVFDLDKSNILNYNPNKVDPAKATANIDSIPVANLALDVRLNGTASLQQLTTDAEGRVTFQTTWSALGIADSAPNGTTATIGWAGSYEGQDFMKLSRVTIKK